MAVWNWPQPNGSPMRQAQPGVRNWPQPYAMQDPSQGAPISSPPPAMTTGGAPGTPMGAMRRPIFQQPPSPYAPPMGQGGGNVGWPPQLAQLARMLGGGAPPSPGAPTQGGGGVGLYGDPGPGGMPPWAQQAKQYLSATPQEPAPQSDYLKMMSQIPNTAPNPNIQVSGGGQPAWAQQAHQYLSAAPTGWNSPDWNAGGGGAPTGWGKGTPGNYGGAEMTTNGWQGQGQSDYLKMMSQIPNTSSNANIQSSGPKQWGQD